jgi:EmrB/QacA subfamily drug resistance transporter
MVNTVTPAARPFVIASIMLATFMAAIEGTIVATAMPSIVGQLGGFTYYSWVFSAYLLAQSTTTVIYGKLSDLFGRKPTLIVGIVLLLLGSLLCGFAWSMTSLVAFRLLQGLGAGAIFPITITIIGDLYKLEERGHAQGMMASVWAISGVLGPLAGGLIVDHFSWAWIFWVNLPIGLVTILGLAIFLHESVETHRARIDYLGALLFSVSTGSVLALLTETDAHWWILLGLAVVFVATGACFFVQERRAPEPIVSIKLWSRRLIATSAIATLLAGMALIGLTTVLPIYVQGVLGGSPLVGGFTLSALAAGGHELRSFVPQVRHPPHVARRQCYVSRWCGLPAVSRSAQQPAGRGGRLIPDGMWHGPVEYHQHRHGTGQCRMVHAGQRHRVADFRAQLG